MHSSQYVQNVSGLKNMHTNKNSRISKSKVVYNIIYIIDKI